MYNIIKDYHDNEILRASFNTLAEKTFGLNFEDWYQNGFWGDKYNPYSIVIEDKVVANVSVNQTDFIINGQLKHVLQLGTVMTDEAYRNQGLIRQIMEEISCDYDGKVDGIYLFAGDDVLDFYPKFGFRKQNEYQYSMQISNFGTCQFEKRLMADSDAWQNLQTAMKKNIFHGKCDMVNNPELIMFYVTKFLQENVYYHADSDTYIIANMKDDSVFIEAVFSSTLTDIHAVIALLGETIKTVTLGFTPNDANGFTITEIPAEDCTFFIKGETLEVIEREQLRIPSLSHA